MNFYPCAAPPVYMHTQNTPKNSFFRSPRAAHIEHNYMRRYRTAQLKLSPALLVLTHRPKMVSELCVYTAGLHHHEYLYTRAKPRRGTTVNRRSRRSTRKVSTTYIHRRAIFIPSPAAAFPSISSAAAVSAGNQVGTYSS